MKQLVTLIVSLLFCIITTAGQINDAKWETVDSTIVQEHVFTFDHNVSFDNKIQVLEKQTDLTRKALETQTSVNQELIGSIKELSGQLSTLKPKSKIETVLEKQNVTEQELIDLLTTDRKLKGISAVTIIILGIIGLCVILIKATYKKARDWVIVAFNLMAYVGILLVIHAWLFPLLSHIYNKNYIVLKELLLLSG